MHTAHGTVRAPFVVRATEGYTARLAGHRRAVAPVYSLIVATEPLPDSTWDAIGLRQRETFSDHRHLIVYGQRSADGRMIFGGRGAPYHFGSRITAGYDRVPRVFAALRQTVVELFPMLRDARITHSWGGPLGIARDWHASVGLDRGLGSGLGRRLRRRRGVDDQPGRPHAGRPDHRPGHRADPAALGRAPQPQRGSPSRCAGSASTPGCKR